MAEAIHRASGRDPDAMQAVILAVRRELGIETTLWRWGRDKTTAQAAAALRGEASS